MSETGRPSDARSLFMGESRDPREMFIATGDKSPCTPRCETSVVSFYLYCFLIAISNLTILSSINAPSHIITFLIINYRRFRVDLLGLRHSSTLNWRQVLQESLVQNVLRSLPTGQKVQGLLHHINFVKTFDVQVYFVDICIILMRPVALYALVLYAELGLRQAMAIEAVFPDFILRLTRFFLVELL